MLPRILANKRWQYLLLLAATGILQSFCLIWLIGWARDIAEGGVEQQHVLSWGIGIVAILFLAAGRYVERFYAELLAQRYIFVLRQTVFEKSQCLPTKDFRVADKGGTMLRLTGDMTAIRNWIVQGMAPLIVIGLWFSLSVIALAQLHYLLVAALILPVLIALVGNYLLGRFLFTQSEQLRRRRGEMIRNVTEKLRQLPLIRAYNQSAKESRRFARQSERLMTSQIRRARISALMRGVNEAVLLFAMLALISTGLYLQQKGVLSGEYMAVLMTAALYLLGQLRRLTRLYEFWTLKKVAEKKLRQFLSRDTHAEGRRSRLKGTFKLELQQIASEGRLLPQSYLISADSRIQLRGLSGSGKSTLLSVIAGLTRVSGGRILLCDKPYKSYRTRLISQQISLVSSDLPLLRGSLKKNLLYGARSFTDDDLNKVRDLCHLNSSHILPDDLKARIEEGGANLSACLNYRIMLARALLRKPALLLLDEDVAHQSSVVQEVIGDVARVYPGAMILCADFQGVDKICPQRWFLNSADEQADSVENKNVIPMEHYAKGK
ncbi:ABC transporter transmembrane domain-containing protein [Amphritea japonica]|uniref:ABC transporter permease protein n=1 Tax=Amphritea japonica ATCC BAA-1530 TaxID=1278309 RepID=A0A7R6P5I0_9GAMM|nr:ABC transporter ATP-binding protein [Amphritea japonica]BBB27604.1 ABC transporter permease protein [Amphritea japonica ATCC BAA-1530]